MLLFAWLVWSIDHSLLVTTLRKINVPLFLCSIAVLIGSDFLKVVRWHLLLRLAGLPSRMHYAWQTYNVGLFLGLITPGKIGEFGRAAYLKSHGAPPSTAIALVILDRLFDVFAIMILALFSVSVLFGPRWALIAVCILLAAGCLFWGMWRTAKRRKDCAWIAFLQTFLRHPSSILRIALLTFCSWGIYCLWAVLLASCIGIHPPLLPFVSSVIFAGIVALLPIAPSGLGTRDATLLWLLAPYGVAAPQTIALSFMMFMSIVATSLMGAWYWLWGIAAPLVRAERDG